MLNNLKDYQQEDCSAGAYIHFSPVPQGRRATKPPIAAGILALLFLAGGALAIIASIIATRPYQAEAAAAKAQAVAANKEAIAAKSELTRVRRCVAEN